MIFRQLLLTIIIIISMKVLLFILVLLVYAQNISPLCKVCHSFVHQVQRSIPKRPALKMLELIAYQYCVKKHLQDKKICKGAIKQMTQYILTGLWRKFTNPHIICQQIKMCSNQYVKRDLKIDIMKIIKDKPQKEWQQPTKRKVLRVMHISDLHPDLFYSPGSPVICTEPVCCRSNVTAKGNNTKKAGYWGSLGQCDVPLQTFDVFLEELKKQKLDAIIWTGDNTPHDIWQQSQSYNLNFTIILSQKLKNATNVTIIPSMGNHESYPVNVYDFKNKSRQQILNKGLSIAWQSWLDDNARKMQSEKGYFKMVYPQLNNVKVLSINTQAGNNENWVLLGDPSDPGQMLSWIENQLRDSQKINQKVYIIGHIPPKSNLNEWSMRFNALVDRYSYIIRGQFYGHTHSDQFSFFPKMKNLSDIQNAQITNYYLVAPSMTTSTMRVPQYRIMQIDYDTLQLLDYSQYRLDLRKFQTSDQKPQFQLFYRFKQSWQIKDMRIKYGITELRNKLRQQKQFQKLYQIHRCAGLCEPTNFGKETFCGTTTSQQFESQCNGNVYKKSKFEQVAGPWRQFKHSEKYEQDYILDR